MNGLFALIEREKPFSIAACLPTEKGNRQVAKQGNIWMIFEGKLFKKDCLIDSCNHGTGDCLDADIALALFIRHGTQSFALLEGYWSLLVVDEDKQKIYAARDFLGNKPVYYCKTGTQFGIAADISTLFSTLKEAKKINKEAVFDFLLWGNTGKQSQNFFSNIHELKPSCYLSYSLIDNIFEEKSYYILPYKNCKGGYNEYEEPFHIDKTRQLILDSVDCNIKSQNKLAVSFSDEINSSALLCCARKLNRNIPLTAFIPTDLQNDTAFLSVEKAIKQTNADLVKIPCGSQLIIKQLEEANKMQNMPVSSLHAVIQYYTMATAKRHGFDAVMDGQGANELFAGYSSYFLPFLKSLRSQWMFKDWVRELRHLQNSDISYKEIFTQKWNSLTKKINAKEFTFLNKEYITNYFSHFSINKEDELVLNDYLHESYTVFLPPTLRLGGHATARFGMDYLLPFSNSKALAEHVFSIPSTFKIHNGWNNYLLRASMVGIVPDEIRWQKQKTGMYVLEKKYFNEIGNKIKKQIQELEDTDNLVDKNALLNEWENLYNANNLHFQRFVFRYYSYLVWRNEGL